MTTKGYIIDHDGTSIDNIRYDDIQGEVSTAPTGASQWATAQIGLTGFFINWLQGGADDFFQMKLQMPHSKALSTKLNIHVHYILSAAPSENETVKLNYAYTWVNANAAIPLIASWITDTKTITFTGTEAALTHYVADIVTNIDAPGSETYSSIFLFKCTRNSLGDGADTYGENFGLLYLDGHIQKNRLGSVSEYND